MDIVILFSNWTAEALLSGILSLLTLIIMMESTTRFLISKKSKTYIKRGIHALRIFLRFELVALFLFMIEKPDGPPFPWNIIYRFTFYLLMGSGVVRVLFILIDTTIEHQHQAGGKNRLLDDLLHTSARGMKGVLNLMFLSVLLWKMLEFVPEEFISTRWFGALVLAYGLFVSTLILIVIRKTLRFSIKSLEGNEHFHKVTIILRSLVFPLQLIIPIITLSWLNSIYNAIIPLSIIFEKGIQLMYLAAVFTFTYRIVELFGVRLSLLSEEDTNPLDKTFIELLRMIIRIALIFIGAISIIRILTGKPLTTLLAGLGIGGLALALAAQDTLKNFFGSLMIMTDKPFKIGDRIQIMNYDGVIEEIGFRSTKIRTLVGHQVVVPNDQMATISVENIGRRPHIRRKTDITLTYSTSPEKMEKALEIVRALLENHEGMTENFPPRVYFSEFNADSLNLLMIYWYSPPDYWKFMDFSESLNLNIMKEFQKEEIEFAFPTNTTYLEQQEGASFTMEWNKKK